MNGRMYDPEGKRPILYAEKPFPSVKKKEQVPSWLERIKSETAAQVKARVELEAEKAEAEKVKAEEDQKEIAEASFLGEGENSGTVETL